jgi:hypothetical protein
MLLRPSELLQEIGIEKEQKTSNIVKTSRKNSTHLFSADRRNMHGAAFWRTIFFSVTFVASTKGATV